MCCICLGFAHPYRYTPHSCAPPSPPARVQNSLGYRGISLSVSRSRCGYSSVTPAWFCWPLSSAWQGELFQEENSGVMGARWWSTRWRVYRWRFFLRPVLDARMKIRDERRDSNNCSIYFSLVRVKKTRFSGICGNKFLAPCIVVPFGL